MRSVALSILYFLLATVISPAQQAPFSNANITLPQLGYSACAWGDFDHDGDLDLALTGTEGNNAVTKILRNDSGTFTSVDAGPALHYGSLEWGDADLDGDLDLLATGMDQVGTPYTRIMINTDGSFATGGISLDGVMDGQATFGDVNNDGVLDILVAGSSMARIYSGDGSGNYTNLNAGLPNLEAAMCSWVDYNNDGQSDVFVCGNTGGGMVSKLFRNDQGVFSEVTISPEPFTGLYGGQCKWADLDNDGDQDLVIAGTDLYVDGHFIFYRNDGNGQFAKFDFPQAAFLNPYFDLADYNADGLTDVALIGTTPGCGGPPATILLRNDGEFNFSIVSTLIPGYKLGGLTWGDYNNDGYSDLLISGLDGFDVPATSIYLNNLGDTALYASNTPPTPPGNPFVTMENGKAILHWSSASDAQTPKNALTYNIRIGTQSDSYEILSPLAFLYSGHRTVAAPGNTGSDTSWNIGGMAAGTYYFSVQAIDNGFMPGAFSSPFLFDYQPVGIDKQEDGMVNILPNPCSSTVRIGYTNPSGIFMNQTAQVELSIFNSLGIMVHRQHGSGNINVSSWPAGPYLVRYRHGNRVACKTMIKEH